MKLWDFYLLTVLWIGGLLTVTGLKTVVVVHENKTCSAPAQYVTITSSLTCTPQIDHYDAACLRTGAQYSISDCTNYNRGGWDNFGIVNRAFGNYSYLGVEKYTAGRCGQPDALTSATIYRLDENCYSNPTGTSSHRLTLDHSVTITTYSDPTCTTVDTITTIRQADTGIYRNGMCVNELTAFFGAVVPKFTAVASFNDNTCSTTPTQIKFSQDFKCSGTVDAPCQYNAGSYFSIAGCANSFSDYSASMFGMNSPYITMEEFPNPWCSDVEFVTVYSADGLCHTSTDGMTSFRASINTVDSTASITMYSDPSCNFVTSNTDLDSQTLSSSMCVRQNCDSWVGCSRRYSVGGLGGPSSLGRKIVVLDYGADKCSGPPQYVTLTRSLTCAPQTNHYDPICVSNGGKYGVSDCTNYFKGGWDDIGIIREAFGNSSYLGMEKYAAGRCAQFDALTSVAMYRLDENCYSDADGTSSHRLTLDHSVTITTFNDATCTNVATTTTIRQSDMSANRNGMCVNELTAFVSGGSPIFTALAGFDDNACSTTPTQVKFSRDFKCLGITNAPCQSDGGGLHFSTAGCSSNYLDYSSSVFGKNSPYIVVEDFPNSWCSDVEFVTVYSSDGSCHTSTDGMTSFRASINVDARTATVTTYSDMECTMVYSDTNLDSQTLLSSTCLRQNCEFLYGCGRRYSVGGLEGPPAQGRKVAVVAYSTDKCSGPPNYLTLTSAMTCTPQTNHYDPACLGNGGRYSVSDCTNYNRGGWDDIGIIRDVFGNSSYLGVEKYVAGRCALFDSMTSATMYRLDENCYPSVAGTSSHRLTLGHSAIITTYSDATCTNVAMTTTVKQADMGASRFGLCLSELTAFFGGTPPKFTAVASFSDNTCSTTPTQVKFSQDFKCLGTADAPCKSDGGSHFSTAGCASSFLDYSTSVFGMNSPYVVVEEFPNPWCSDVEFVTVYSADGLCHTSPDGVTSFKAFINVVHSTASITMFSDPSCTIVASDTNLDSQTLLSSPCMGQSCENWLSCSRRYSVGGLGGPLPVGKKTAVVVYEDSSCAVTPTVLTITSTLQCTANRVSVTGPVTGTVPNTATAVGSSTSSPIAPIAPPVCNTLFAGANAVYQARECINEIDDFVDAKFRSTPYLYVEYYANGTNCQVQNNITLYAGDGKCHLSPTDGKFFILTQNPNGAVTIANYPTASCNAQDSDAFSFVLDSWNVNSGVCVDNKIFRTSKLPLATEVYSPTPTPTPTPPPVTVSMEDNVEARLKIMFPDWLWDSPPPQVFVSDGRP